MINTTKTGIFYSQRITEKEYNVAAIETAMINLLQEYEIQIVKTFSDFGYHNLQRPGLNALIHYLINSGDKIDLIAFYSFDHLGRDEKRLQYVLPRIQKHVNEIIFINNIADFYHLDQIWKRSIMKEAE